MPDDEKLDQEEEEKEDAGETEEDEDVMVIDLTKTLEDEPASERETKDETKKEEKEKTQQHQEPEIEKELDKFRKIIREEISSTTAKQEQPQEQKQLFTEEQLRQAEDELDKKLEDGEITQTEFRRIQRIIDGHRYELREREREERQKAQIMMETVNTNVTNWAKQHLPEILEENSNESKEAIKFLETVMGAQKKDNMYVISDVVAKTMAGILVKASSQQNQAEAQKEERKKQLLSKQPPKAAAEQKTRGVSENLSKKEMQILSQIGLRRNRLDLYRKFKQAGKKHIDIED